MPELTLAVRLSADGSQLIGELKESEVAMDKLERGTKDMGQASVRASKDIDQMADQTDRMTGSAGSLTSGLFSLRNTVAALGIGALVRDIVQAGTQFESWESKIKLATGSSQAAGDAIGFVREEADRLGISLESSIEGFSSLSVAAKGTAFEGEGVRDIFTAVSEASSVLRLSQEETSGVMRGFTQIASKAVLSMEEMQQLAERGVPANLLYASAFTELGLTTGDSVSEMLKLVSAGKVLSSDALPAITRELRKFVASGVEEAAESSTASFNRLSTAIFSLKVSIAESGFIDFLADIAKRGAGAINTLKEIGINLGIIDSSDRIQQLNIEIQKSIKQQTSLRRQLLEVVKLSKRQPELNLAQPIAEYNKRLEEATGKTIDLQDELEMLEGRAKPAAGAVGGLAGSLGGLSGKSGEAAESLSNVDAALKQFEESIITDAEKTQILISKIEILDRLLRQDIITWEEYGRRIEIVTGKQSEFSNEVEKTKDPVAEITHLASPFADAWERAINEIDQSFADLWKSAFQGFEGFADRLENAFFTLLAELAHAAITRPILVQLGLGGLLGGGAAAAGAGALGGLLPGGGSILDLAGTGANIAGAGKAISALLESGLAGLGPLIGPAISSFTLGILGKEIFGEGGGIGAGLGAALGGAFIPGPFGALLGGAAGGFLGGLFGGGQVRPTKITAGAFPLGTDIGNLGTTVASPFGHDLGFFGARIGDEGQLSNEDYLKLVDDVTVLFRAVADIDQVIIDTVGDLEGDRIGAMIDDLVIGTRLDSPDAIQRFISERFETIFGAINEPLGDLFDSLSEGLEAGAVADLAAGFAGIFAAMEDGTPVFSDVADVTETISILFSEFVEEGESVISALSRIAQASQLLSLIGFDDTSVAGSQTAVDTLGILGGDRLTELIDTYLRNFFSPEELIQSQLDRRRPGLEDQLSGLGTGADTFRADFEEAISGGDITADAIAAWLETAEALSIVTDLTEQLNKLQVDQVDTTDDLLSAEREQVLAIREQIAGLSSLNDAYMLSNQTLAQSVQRQRSELLRLAFSYDGSANSAQQLAGATETLRQVELALLAQIDSAANTINASFGGAIRNIELALLDTEGQYEFLRSEAEALAQVLSALTDPQEILSTAQQIQQLASQAFGLLTEEQLQSVGSEFIGFLDSVSDTANSQLEAQREATLSAGEQVMQVVEASLNRAFQQFHQAASTMVGAANSMASAAATMRVASQQPVQAQVIIQSDVVGL